MKRLIRLVVALSAMLAALVFLVRIYAQSHPESNTLRAVDFDFCDGRLCFLKIVPGVTKWEAVEPAIIHSGIAEFQARGSVEAGYQVLRYDTNGIHIEFSSTSQSSIDLIDIGYLEGDPRLTLGMVIAKYGIPCGVSFYPIQCNTYIHCSGLASVSLYYDSLIVGATLREPGSRPGLSTEIKSLDPALPINNLSLFNPTRFSKTSTDPCHVRLSEDEIGSTDSPWLGFASTGHYLQFGASGSGK